MLISAELSSESVMLLLRYCFDAETALYIAGVVIRILVPTKEALEILELSLLASVYARALRNT